MAGGTFARKESERAVTGSFVLTVTHLAKVLRREKKPRKLLTLKQRKPGENIRSLIYAIGDDSNESAAAAAAAIVDRPMEGTREDEEKGKENPKMRDFSKRERIVCQI